MSKSIFELFNEQNSTPKESKEENVSYKDEKEEEEKIVTKETTQAPSAENPTPSTETPKETTQTPSTENPTPSTETPTNEGVKQDV